MKYQYAHDISGKIVSFIFPTQSLVMQENFCGILFLLTLNQRKLKRKQVEGQRAIPFNSDTPLWNNNKNAKNKGTNTVFPPQKQLIFPHTRQSKMLYVSTLLPLGGGESHPPPHPPTVRGWRRMTFQTTYRLEIFQRPKVLTQSSPSEMTFKAPLRKSRPWGKRGKRGAGLWILNGIALT